MVSFYIPLPRQESTFLPHPIYRKEKNFAWFSFLEKRCNGNVLHRSLWSKTQGETAWLGRYAAPKNKAQRMANDLMPMDVHFMSQHREAALTQMLYLK